MIKIMDNENREEWGTDLLAVMESIQAVVNALSSGRIEPFAQSTKVRSDLIRYAPSFIPGKVPCSPKLGEHVKNITYTIADVARFLGRMRRDKEADYVVNAAFAVLELEEHGVEGWNR